MLASQLIMITEGVIQFEANHEQEDLQSSRYGDLVCRLIAWREILCRLGWVGQDAHRYGGFGFGNVSARVGPASLPRRRRCFLITGTQTGEKRCMALSDFCLVESCDYEANRVASRGSVQPSSESMTHAAVYDQGPHIRFVFHGHCPVIWQRAQELHLPTTPPSIGYGTPEMAMSVRHLFQSTALDEIKVLSMGGHEDGIVAFGRSAEEAGRALLGVLARAYEAACFDDRGSLCSDRCRC